MSRTEIFLCLLAHYILLNKLVALFKDSDAVQGCQLSGMLEFCCGLGQFLVNNMIGFWFRMQFHSWEKRCEWLISAE